MEAIHNEASLSRAHFSGLVFGIENISSDAIINFEHSKFTGGTNKQKIVATKKKTKPPSKVDNLFILVLCDIFL